MKLTNELRANIAVLENEIAQLVRKFLEENGNCHLDINTDYIDTSNTSEKSFTFNKVQINLLILSC